MTAPESPQPVDAPDDDKSHVPPLTTRVVIAEDEALIRLDLKEMLEEEGYTVVGEAGDGEQAVELAREHKPDLVILDVKMPEAGRHLRGREDRRGAHRPGADAHRVLAARPRGAGPGRRCDGVSGEAVQQERRRAGHRDGGVAVHGAEGAGEGGRGPHAAAGDAEAGGPGEVDPADGVRAVGAGRVPVDPEDVDGPADVDAAGRRGGDRGRGARRRPRRADR